MFPASMFLPSELQVLAGLMNGKTLAEIGQELLVSHPAVSKMVRAMELKAGLKLADRRGRKLHLTPAGAKLARAAELLLSQMREMDTMVAGMRAGSGETLRLLTSGASCDYLLRSALGQLMSILPHVEVHVWSWVLGDFWDHFVEGAYDIGIAATQPPPGLLVEHLFEDEICLCVGPSSELANRSNLTWGDLSGQALIVPPPSPFGTRLWQVIHLGVHAGSRIESRSAELSKMLALDGRGVALLFRSTVMDELARGQLIALELDDRRYTMPYWMALRGSDDGASLRRSVADLLQQAAEATQRRLAG
ncbi:MAG TPA: LysR family transcriptional regulator [Chloroflexota bacterium]|nr:LysR family transcriptional regulator [Chloroflexota bacterium]